MNLQLKIPKKFLDNNFKYSEIQIDEILESEDENELSENIEIIQAEKEDIQEVMEAISFTSEEIHGGNEATGDIEDSPNALEDGENNNDSDNENSECDQNSEYEDSNYQKRKKRIAEKNYNQAYRLHCEYQQNKRLATELDRVLSKVSEDLSGFDIEGEDLWDIEQIMKRKFTSKSILHCKKSVEKESLVLLLDTSGSCYDYSNFFMKIANYASKNKTVQVYTCPNGRIDEEFKDSKLNWVDYSSIQLKNRTIIFFGDFDAGAEMIEFSKKNKVYWFSCENRYDDLLDHSWNNQPLSVFKAKGKYYQCFNEEDFIRLSKKIR